MQMSFLVRTLPVFFLLVAAAASSQIVIRERVEVHPAPTDAARMAAGCSGPIVGYDVYTAGPAPNDSHPLTTQVIGGPLEATVAVQTDCGLYEADLASGFVLVDVAAIGAFTQNSSFATHVSATWADCVLSNIVKLLQCRGPVGGYVETAAQRAGYLEYARQVFTDTLGVNRSMRVYDSLKEAGVDFMDAYDLMVQDTTRQGISNLDGNVALALMDTTPDLIVDLLLDDDATARIIDLVYATEDGRIPEWRWANMFDAESHYDRDGPDPYTRASLTEDLADITQTYRVHTPRARRRRQTELRGALAFFGNHTEEGDLGPRYEIAAPAYLVRSSQAAGSDVRLRIRFRSEIFVADTYPGGGEPKGGDLDVVVDGLAYELKATETGNNVDGEQLEKNAAAARLLGYDGWRLATPLPEENLPSHTSAVLGEIVRHYQNQEGPFEAGYEVVPINGRVNED